MKRFVPFVLLAALLAAVVPAAAPAADVTGYTYLGKGSARVLDLDIPALRAVPQNVFKGLTIGLSSAEFSSAPKAAGSAAGRCDYLASTASPTSACDSASRADSTASAGTPTGGSVTAKCLASATIAVVSIAGVCGKSFSDVSSGNPMSTNEGGGGLINVSLDLTNVLPGAGATAEAAKDAAVDLIVSVIKTVDNATPSQAQLDSITQNLVNHLNAIKNATGPAITILNGVATSNVTSDATKASITSQIAGVKIGLLGITDPLTDGLVIVEVTGASATATWDKAKTLATAVANPGVATLKVKDVASLCGTNATLNSACSAGYILTSAALPQLNNLFSSLNGTLLETSIEAATATPKQEGLSAAASTNGLRVRAIKGIGATSTSGVSCGSCDGGLDLRIAAADVSISGAPIVQQNPPLPQTGGALFFFFTGAAVLAGIATFGLATARRIRKRG